MKRFGTKLRNIRNRHGLTMLELAQKIGHSTHSHISEIEAGKRLPSLNFAIKVSKMFDVSLDSLLDDKKEIS
jgi:transcriptional regulator with XRE-family HTH domain